LKPENTFAPKDIIIGGKIVEFLSEKGRSLVNDTDTNPSFARCSSGDGRDARVHDCDARVQNCDARVQNDCVDDGHPAFLAFWCRLFGSL